ncbi:hypothetical protein J4209_00215 [Candidatus Woesearchaeota archaeon]|nr:hypothetical protein [Candidatus Woesearchaeota archaeon]
MTTELIIEITSVIFGLTALFLASKARQRLSPGSIRKYIDNFSVCLVFIVIFSLWQTVRDIATIQYGIGEIVKFPEYIFIIGAYIAFIISAYRVVHISHEFGFKKEGASIGEILEERKKKK